MGKPVTPPAVQQGFSSAAYNQAAGVSGRPGSPGAAVLAAQPFVAQHNNLMGGSSGSSTPTGRASPSGMSKLRDRLTGHASAPGSSATVIEAFKEPEEQRVVAISSSTSSFTAPGSSGNSAVAQRPAGKATRLLATGHASAASRTAAEWQAEFKAAVSSGDKLAALHLPGPSSSIVQCYVRRINGMLGMAPSFELRLESSDELLAVARRRKKSATSSYLISTGASAAAVTRGDEELTGKLKANVLGTEFLLCGKGGDPVLHKGFNAQLLAVNFKPTINQVKAGPRTMTACVPVPEAMQAWDGSAGNGQYDSLLTCMDAARARELPMSLERNLVMLHTMKPHYDPVKEVHYLDFKGRVTKLSTKNFQLVHWDHNSNQLGNDLVMQFGKKGHGEYALDFCYPLSLLQAFALGAL
ncbi:hypothetical protein OEZ86_006380 [Tetradesmus obliquus]|nr:hypothetical protein OEZ86_006380 [Tetradesmus obliquus]